MRDANWLATHSYIAAWASPAIALSMQAESHFSWVQGFVIPVLFTLLGAGLGVLTSVILDDWKAKRAKKSFMRAVGMELDALRVQLEASLREVNESTQRVISGGDRARFAGILRTSVFNAQIGKLRDVDDEILIQISHFYSDLRIIEQIFIHVVDADDRYDRATGDMQKAVTRAQLLSTLRVLQEQISGFGNQLKVLRAKLPPAEQAK